MSESDQILLQGGTLLVHGDDDSVTPVVSDLLIEGSIISKIGSRLPKPSAKCEVIDCRGKIISPGFIDTHRHLWQTQNKGQHADASFAEYLPRGNCTAIFWTPEDLFWGQLAGALEAISAGTTTLVDHASCNTSPAHPQAAIQALLSSGIRAVYCYTGTRSAGSDEPLAVKDDDFSEANLAGFRALAKASPFDGRVHMGYALDNLYAPREVVQAMYAALRDAEAGRAQLITTHDISGPMRGPGPTTVQLLQDYGLLGPDVLVSHANAPAPGDGALYAASGAHVATTPSAECQAGALPVALREDHRASASLGVDCHSWGSASMPQQARLLLQSARLARGLDLAARGRWSRHTGFAVERVFNLCTRGGARAVGLAGEIGRLAAGMRADVVVFDGLSPAMLAAAVANPVAAVVLHSSERDVELVVIDGVVRKRAGRLLDVRVAPAPDPARGAVPAGARLAWPDVAARVLESQAALEARMKDVDFARGVDVVIDSLHLCRETLIEQ